MAEDWAAAAADVDAGFRESGFEVTLHQPASDGAFDPATDTKTGASPAATHTAFAIEGKAYSTFSISTGLVEAGDVRLLLSTLMTNGQPLPAPVADAWTVTVGGKLHTIKRVETTKPAETAILYELQLRA